MCCLLLTVAMSLTEDSESEVSHISEWWEVEGFMLHSIGTRFLPMASNECP